MSVIQFLRQKWFKRPVHEEVEKKLPLKLSQKVLKHAFKNASPLLNTLHLNLVQFTDHWTDLLISSDQGASQLALYLQTLNVHDHWDQGFYLLLKHNLVLNGIFGEFLDALWPLSDQTIPEDKVLEKGRHVLIQLLFEWTRLAYPEIHPIHPWHPQQALHLLSQYELDHRFDVLKALLEGRAPKQEVFEFLSLSYLLFLEAVLLRSVVRLLPLLPSL